MKVDIDGRSVTLKLDDGRQIHLSANDDYLHVNVEGTTGMVVTGGAQPGQGKELGVSNIANIYYSGEASPNARPFIQPLAPDFVEIKKAEVIPPEVIEAVNELIAEHWNGHSATLKIGAVRRAIAAKLGIESGKIKQQWLDFEPIYRNMGWKCSYDKPGYNETYEGFYEFKKGRRS